VEFKDAITAIGIFISTGMIIAGWFVSRHKEREHEKFRSRLAKTEELLQAARDYQLSGFELAAANGTMSEEDHSSWRKENNDRWQKLSWLTQAFGNNELIGALRKIGSGDSVEKSAKALAEFQALLIKTVRRDLGYTNES
jgi:hypothetical protein